MKLAHWFWRRWFFKFLNEFSLFRNYFPLEKGGALHLINLDSLNPRMICAKFGWNWSSGSGEEDENVKSLQQRRRRRQRRRKTHKLWSEKLTWTFGSDDLKSAKEHRACSKYINFRRSLLVSPLRWFLSDSLMSLFKTGYV